MSDSVLVMDPAGQILFANTAAHARLGFSPTSLVGMPIHALVPAEHWEMASQALHQSLAGSQLTLRIPWKSAKGASVHMDSRFLGGEWSGAVCVLAISQLNEYPTPDSDRLTLQRDLAVALNGVDNLSEALKLTLETALSASEMDCGGIYLHNDAKNALELVHHFGITAATVQLLAYYDATSPNYQMALQGHFMVLPLQLPLPELKELHQEGLKVVGVMPMLYQGRLVACINVASHTLPDISEPARRSLEAIASQTAAAVARLKAEEHLRLSEDRYHQLMAASYDGITLVDSEGRVVEWNASQERITGLSRDEVLGQPLSEILFRMQPEEQRTEASRHRLRLSLSPFSEHAAPDWLNQPIERILQRPDGALRTVQSLSFLVPTANGLFVGGFLRDVTERREIEQSLKESRQQTRDLLRALPDAFFLLTIDGKIVDYHIPDPRILQLPIELHINPGMSALSVMPPHASAIFQPAWKRLQENGENQIIEYERTSADDRARFLEIRLIRVDAGYVLVLVRDITQRKETEARQRALEAQVRDVQKLESLGVMAGGMAHDFNNLLTTILGNADLALSTLPHHSLARESIEEVIKASSRAANLTSQILAYSGKGRFLVERVHLPTLLRSMQLLLRSSISKSIDLRFEYAEPLPEVDADSSQLRQMITNVLLNASEAIGENAGSVVVRVGSRYCDADCVAGWHLSEHQEAGDFVTLEVSDNGEGMSPAVRQQIFDPFFSTRFIGRGLGLPAVLGIVRGHGGGIRVESSPGVGTRITIFLPISKNRPE